MRRAPCGSCFTGLLLTALVMICTSCVTSDTASILDFALPSPTAQQVKLLVDKDGIYAVAQRDLLRAGMEIAQFNTAHIHLSENGRPVPFLIKDNLLIFYGQAARSRYTASRAYLVKTGQQGTIMSQAEVGEIETPVLNAIPQTLHLEENHVYRANARAEDNDDVWFWQELRQQEVFEIEAFIPLLSQGAAQIKVSSWGFTDLPDSLEDHTFSVLINGEQVGSVVWDGQRHHESAAHIPDAVLTPGVNKITLDNRPGGATSLDIMQINWLELTYQAPAVADDDRLYFSGVAGLAKLSGFSQTPLIFDISDSRQPKLLQGWLVDGEDVSLSVVEEMQIAAIGPQGYYRPLLQPVQTSEWRSPEKQADLIIITTSSLAPYLAPLVQARQNQGLSVAVLNIQEVYDTFGFGNESPESIRAFVNYAYRSWQEPRPRYLLLVGDATTDYLGYANEVPANNIPSLLVPVSFGGETVSDSRLVDVDDDSRPELAVGRWPVRSPEQVKSLVARTLAYEQGHAGSKAIFITDNSEERFQAIAQRIASNSHFSGVDLEMLSDTRSEKLAEAWNEGAWLTTYVGHGSVSRWGKDNILSTDTVGALKSDMPPIVMQLTCLTGLFAHPQQTSLVETMLNQSSGPVLSIAATSLTLSGHQEPFAMQLLQNLQDSNIVRIGDAFQKAKLGLATDSEYGLQEISDTFLLFGDPSTLIVRP